MIRIRAARRALLACASSVGLLAHESAAQQADAGAARAAARAYRSGHEGTILAEFATLLALPNLASDSAGIRRNADTLVAMLTRRGVHARLLELEGVPPVVFGELRSPGASKTIVLYAHYDGQPVDARQWTGAPWTPILRDRPVTDGGHVISLPVDGDSVAGESRLYARSAGDDKGSIMAMLAALDALRAAGRRPSVNLKFFFEGEEEAGSPHLRAILERYASLLAADGWLFCDGPVHQSGQIQAVFGLRGVVGLELTVYGPTRALHSGHYGNWAPNPGVLLAHLIASMRDEDGQIRIAGYYDDVRPISASERRALAALPAVDATLRRQFGLARTENANAPVAERVMLPALNVRGIRVGNVGDLAANAIPTEAQASFDFRLVPDQRPEHVRELVERHVRAQGFFIVHDSATQEVRLSHPKVARLVWESGYPASRTSMDLPFSRALVAAMADGAPAPPLRVPTLGGSGPTYLFTEVLKAPVVALPIANYDDNQHAANENLRLQNLWDGIELYAAVLTRIGVHWSGPAIQ